MILLWSSKYQVKKTYVNFYTNFFSFDTITPGCLGITPWDVTCTSKCNRPYSRCLLSLHVIYDQWDKRNVTWYFTFRGHTSDIIIRCKFFFLFIGRKSTTWPANNCLQIMFCSCAVPSNCVLCFAITLAWKMADRFASRRHSLKNKPGDRMIKQLLNSDIPKYRDLSVSRRSLHPGRLTGDANDFVNAKSHARKKPLLTRYWTVQVTLTSSSSVFLLMRRGGGELPNNDTAPAGSWNATQSQSESILYNINRGFTVFSHGTKHVVFSFGSVDESILMKPLGALSHGTTYLARSSYCWSVDKNILI